MTAMLLRLHPSFQGPTRWVALGTATLLLTTLATGALVAARTSTGREVIQDAAWLVASALLWGTISVQLLLPAARTRAGVFAMTLPVSGRRLWLVALAASVASGMFSMLVMLAVLSAANWLLGLRTGGHVFAPGSLVSLGIQVASALLLAAALLHLPRPGDAHWPMRGRLGIFALGAVVAPGALLLLLRDSPLVFSLACLAAAGASVVWGLRRQPEAFLLAVDRRDSDGPSASWFPAWPWLTAVRWTIGLPALSGALATVAIFGALQAVLKNRYSEEDETGLFMAPMLVYVMVNWLAMGGRFLHRLEPLPITRRSLAALLTAPVLGFAMLGYLLGLASNLLGPQGLMVEFQARAGRGFPLQRSERPLVRMPSQYFEIAWDGRPPELRAPWGESHAPWQARIWQGASAVLYSPASTTEAVTPEFAAWEIGRALEMVYGVSVPYQRIRTTYVGLDANGQPVLVKELRDLVREGASPASPLRWAVPPLTIGLCGASYLLLSGLLFGLRRADTPMWKRNTAVGVVMAGLLVLYVIRVPLSLSGLTRGWILGGVLSSLVRTAAETTLGGAVTLWLLCAAALWLSFRFATARLRRAEILPEPPRKFGF